MTIFRNLKYFAQCQREKICLAFGEKTLSYGEFASTTEDMALRLAAVFPQGNKVIIKHPDPLIQLTYFFAAVQAGLIVLFLDPKASPETCQKIMIKSGASQILDESYVLPAKKALSLPVVKKEDLFLGALTSGTTGQPKIIWRDHQSWTKAFPAQSKVFDLHGSDRLFLVNSLVYTANLNSCLHLLDQGGSIFFAEGRWPRSWIKEIKERNITAIFMVPAHYRILVRVLKQPLLTVKSIVSAGEKMDLATVKEILEKFPQGNIYEYYGASELGHVSYSKTEDLLKYPHSVGKAFPGVDFSLDSKGRITVTSPYLAPDFRPRCTSQDLGKVNLEGYLFLLGREKGLINKGGIKINPQEVEGVLQRCPGVMDVLVKGERDPLKGQKVAAWIVPLKEGCLSVGELRIFSRENLPKEYRPDCFYLTAEIPRNASGKKYRGEGKGGIYKSLVY